ncbi:unnamed protein product [Merluccius merluccius]
MTDRSPHSAVDRTKVLLFLAAFFQAVGFLFLLACCGSDYWLLAWQSCGTAQHMPSSWFHQDGLGHLTSGDIKSQSAVRPLVDTLDFPPQPSEPDSVIGLSLMVVVLMFLTWFQALGVLEQYASRRRATACPAFHLSVELGPSFLLAPVAVFFCVLAGLLFVLIGRDTQAVPNK